MNQKLFTPEDLRKYVRFSHCAFMHFLVSNFKIAPNDNFTVQYNTNTRIATVIKRHNQFVDLKMESTELYLLQESIQCSFYNIRESTESDVRYDSTIFPQFDAMKKREAITELNDLQLEYIGEIHSVYFQTLCFFDLNFLKQEALKNIRQFLNSNVSIYDIKVEVINSVLVYCDDEFIKHLYGEINNCEI